MTKSGRKKQTMVVTQPAKESLWRCDRPQHLWWSQDLQGRNETPGREIQWKTFFQTKVINASESRCWSSIYKLRQDRELIDLLKQPGKISLVDLKQHCDAVWQGDIQDDETYQAQIHHSMMGAFMIESITLALHQWVQTKKEQWFYANHNVINGLILYKTLISYGAIGSRAGVDNTSLTYLEELWTGHPEDDWWLWGDALPNRIKGGDVQWASHVPLQGIWDLPWPCLQELCATIQGQVG